MIPLPAWFILPLRLLWAAGCLLAFALGQYDDFDGLGLMILGYRRMTWEEQMRPRKTGESHLPSCPCPECHRRRARRARAWWITGLLVAGVALLFWLDGCAAAVVPVPVQAAQASWDGGEQNSGILAATPTGFRVTGHFRDRYNALVEVYGKHFAPALRADDGLTYRQLLSNPPQDSYEIDAQHMQYFIEMNAWRKAGRN